MCNTCKVGGEGGEGEGEGMERGGRGGGRGGVLKRDYDNTEHLHV